MISYCGTSSDDFLIFHAKLPTLSATTMQYADDLAQIITASNEYDLMTNGSQSLRRLNNWLVENKLQLDPAKLKEVIFKGKRCRGHRWVRTR